MQYDLNKELLKILHFYYSFIDTPRIKNLSNIQLLRELPFYDDLNIIINKAAFRGYSKSYEIEIIDKIDVIAQLKSSEISLKDLFKDLLNELKGFKYQITLCVLLSKQKNINEIEYRAVYFNSLTKTVINNNNNFLNNSFKEIIFKLKNWISHGSGWNVDIILNQY